MRKLALAVVFWAQLALAGTVLGLSPPEAGLASARAQTSEFPVGSGISPSQHENGSQTKSGNDAIEVTAVRLLALSVGFAGVWRPGAWTPFAFSVKLPPLAAAEAAGQVLRLEIITPDGDGQTLCWATEVFSAGASCSAVSGKGAGDHSLRTFPPAVFWQEEDLLTVKTSVRFGSSRAWIRCRLFAGSQLLFEQRFDAGLTVGFPAGLRDTQEIYVIVGQRDGGVKEALNFLDRPSHDTPVSAVLSSLNQLPIHPLGYQAVKTLVLSFSEPALLDGSSKCSLELAAVEGWARSGGNLLVGFHPAFLQQAQAGGGGPLEWLVPGKFEQPVPFSRARAAALEMFAGARNPLGGTTTRALASESLAFISEPRGKILAAEGRLPLVIMAPYGLGIVTWCAFPLDSSYLQEWPDRGAFFARVLNLAKGTSLPQDQPESFTRFGFEDLAGQLRASLDRFSGVVLVPFGFVIALMLVHIALVGPVDYFLWRRAGARRWMAWLSFAALALGVSAVASWLGLWAKGTQLRLRQIDLVDVAVTDGWTRNISWAQLYSPVVAQVDVFSQPQAPKTGRPFRLVDGGLAWWGLPGEGFGGMNSLRTGLMFQKDVYFLRPGRDALEGLTLRAGSSKAITVRWIGVGSPPITGELRLKHDEVTGWIRSELECELEDCRLFFGKYVYQLDVLAPQGTLLIDRRTPRRDVRAFLTGTQLVREKDTYRTQSNPYDLESRDWIYVLDMMMFHEAAGGTGYTGLYHVAEGPVDFTPLLRTDQAVFVGRVRSNSACAGSQIRVHVKSRPVDIHYTREAVYRCVFPVVVDTGAVVKAAAL